MIKLNADLSSWSVGIGWRGKWMKQIKYYPFFMIHLLCFTLLIEWNKEEWERNNPGIRR